MQREIKFKAKSIEENSKGHWVEGNLSIIGNEKHGTDAKVFAPDYLYSIQTFKDEHIEVDPDTICQFTGLYDRDGNEVWEGDVLEASNKTIGKVIFEDGCLKVSMNSFGKTELYCWRRAKKLGDCWELPN